MITFIAALLVLGGLALVVAALPWIIARQRAAATDAADQWEWALTAALTPGAHIVRVLTVYQNASTGTKAIIEHRPSGARQDAWFAGRRVIPGQVLLVKGWSSYGPHNHNPHVFYVGSDQSISELPKDAERHWQHRCTDRLSS